MGSLSATSPAEVNLDVGYRGSLGISAKVVVRWILGLVVARVFGVGDSSRENEYGAVQADRSAASRGPDRCRSEELGLQLSRFNGSSWISFRSQRSQQFESKSEDPVDGTSQRGDAGSRGAVM